MRATDLVREVEAELLASIAKRDELLREFRQKHPEDCAGGAP